MVEIAVNREQGNAAKVGSYINESPYVSLVEDVNLNNNRIFIVGQAYDVNSLQPAYGKKWNYNTLFTPIDTTTILNVGIDSSVALTSAGYMALYNGSVQTYAHNELQAIGVSRWNRFVGHTYHMTLDPQNYLPKTMMKLASNNILYTLPYSYQWNSSAFSNTAYGFLYNSTDITAINSMVKGSPSGSGATTTSIENNLLYEDTMGDVIWSHATNGGPAASTYNTQGISYSVGYQGTTETFTTTRVLNTAGFNYYWAGLDVYNNPYFVGINNSAANDPVSVFYIDSRSRSSTTVLSAQQPASPSTLSNLNCLPSNIRTANTSRKVFYTMHYDTAGALAPMRFVWDPTNIGTVTKTNCTMTYSTGNFATYATKPAVPSGANSTNYAQQVTYGKPYQFTVGSNNYVTFTWVDTGVQNANTNYASRFTTSAQRTWVTYQCGSGTGDDTLTYHSKLTFAGYTDMARGWIPTTPSGSTLAVATPPGVKFYSFNTTTGWQASGFYATSGPVHSLGLDQTNRLWGLVGDRAAGSIHIITPQTPVNISLVLPNTSYVYTGTTISTNAALNAYDVNGNRYVANVTITIDGTTMTFANGAKTGTFTTSNTADSNVALSITGGGINNLTTSVNI